jgi:hypothetical protein
MKILKIEISLMKWWVLGNNCVQCDDKSKKFPSWYGESNPLFPKKYPNLHISHFLFAKYQSQNIP